MNEPNPQDMVVEMSRMYGREIGVMEAYLWKTEVFERYPARQVIGALKLYMEGRGTGKRFMPMYGDILEILEPVSEVMIIERAIKSGSPYVAPSFEDPVITQAIQNMGGWPRVCELLPDSTANSFDYDRFVKQLEKAVQSAKQEVLSRGVIPPPLLGISQKSLNQINHSNAGVLLECDVDFNDNQKLTHTFKRAIHQ